MSKYQKTGFSLLFCVLTGSAVAQSEANPIPQVTDAWRFSVIPYVWVPGLMATVDNKAGPVTTADFSMGQVISNMKSGGMGASEVHYGKWGLLGDFFFATLQKQGSLSVTDSAGNIRVSDKATLQASVMTGSATYTIANSNNLYVDALLGARVVFATASLNVNDQVASENISAVFNAITPIAGFKGRYRVANSTWYVPFYADAGSGWGTTSLTWQLMLGVGKAVNRSIDLSLAYRALSADLHGNSSLMKANLKGPQMTMTFSF